MSLFGSKETLPYDTNDGSEGDKHGLFQKEPRKKLSSVFVFRVMILYKLQRKVINTVSYITDEENSVSKMFINLLEIESSMKARFEVKRPLL